MVSFNSCHFGPQTKIQAPIKENDCLTFVLTFALYRIDRPISRIKFGQYIT